MTAPSEIIDFIARGLRVLGHRSGRWTRYLSRRRVRVGPDEILAALCELAPSGPDLLLVHSSLSACGQIRGGAPTVLRSLQTWARGGTIVMPSHSYCYPEENGETPSFDVHTTPSLVGSIAEQFRQRPDILRSAHPSHAVACLGSRCEELCQGHELADSPCGRGTPYEQLVDADASVLMFGAPMSSYTLYHTAEDAARVPYLYYPEPICLRLAQLNGGVREISCRRHRHVEDRFDEIGDCMEREGLLISRRLGRGTLRFIPSASRVHGWLVSQLERDPWFLLKETSIEMLSNEPDSSAVRQWCD